MPLDPTTARGLVMRWQGGSACPTFVCEECGTVIPTLSAGGVVWGRLGHQSDPEERVIILCKGTTAEEPGCLMAPAHRRKSWNPLDVFVGFLLHNTGVRTPAAFRTLVEHSRLAATG